MVDSHALDLDDQAMNIPDHKTFHAHLESLQGSKEYDSTMAIDRPTLQLFKKNVLGFTTGYE
jgi:hypothetical protein